MLGCLCAFLGKDKGHCCTAVGFGRLRFVHPPCIFPDTHPVGVWSAFLGCLLQAPLEQRPLGSRDPQALG